MNRRGIVELALLVALWAAVIQMSALPQTEPTATDYKSLVAALKREGAAITPTDEEITQPFFSPKGRLIKVNTEDIQVFEYKSRAAQEKEAKQVAPSGASVGPTMITWVGTPHFFGAGRIIVIYVGDSPQVLKFLEAVLGRQFAGG